MGTCEVAVGGEWYPVDEEVYKHITALRRRAGLRERVDNKATILCPHCAHELQVMVKEFILGPNGTEIE